MPLYLEQEAAWLSIAGVDPAIVPKLFGEPGAPDAVWADVESGAFAMNYMGERLFLNAHYNRPKGDINQIVRIHHVIDLVDRQATVLMPSDDASVQDDGNLSGCASSAWVVRYGKYLVVMNRSAQAYAAKLPAGSGRATTLWILGTVPMDTTANVAAGTYEVFVLQ